MENEEENKIQEAEISEEVKPEELPENDLINKSKPAFRSRLVLIFVLGFLIGIAFKTEALKKITIGHDDYLMKIKTQNYDINGVQAKLQKAREEAAKIQEEDGSIGNLETKQNDQEGINDQSEN
jgi:hypothetical protein